MAYSNTSIPLAKNQAIAKSADSAIVSPAKKGLYMQHPLVNPSLAPFGFVFSRYKQRLEHKSTFDPHWVNPELTAAKFWQRAHQQDMPGTLPIEKIVHTVLPSMASRWKLDQGDFIFRGLSYLSRDIALISTIMYWFGTNVGRSFLFYPDGIRNFKRHDHEFLEKFNRYMREERDMVAMWTHVCTLECQKPVMTPFGDPHRDNPKRVTARDYAVAEAVMRWLGTKGGRSFIATWRGHIEKLERVAREKRTKEVLAKVA